MSMNMEAPGTSFGAAPINVAPLSPIEPLAVRLMNHNQRLGVALAIVHDMLGIVTEQKIAAVH